MKISKTKMNTENYAVFFLLLELKYVWRRLVFESVEGRQIQFFKSFDVCVLLMIFNERTKIQIIFLHFSSNKIFHTVCIDWPILNKFQLQIYGAHIYTPWTNSFRGTTGLSKRCSSVDQYDNFDVEKKVFFQLFEVKNKKCI